MNGLLWVAGRHSLKDPESRVSSANTTFEPFLGMGDVWAVVSIWKELGLARALALSAGRTRHQIDHDKLIRVMVANQLPGSASKLGVLRWLEPVWLPGVDQAAR